LTSATPRAVVTALDARYTLDLAGIKVGVTSRGIRRGPKKVLHRIAKAERLASEGLIEVWRVL